VKTKRFADPRYIGDPINAVRILNDKRVDELFLLDITATVNKAEPNLDFLEEVVSEASMPVCFGGGISGVDTASRLFSIGIEKVSIQSAAIANPSLIEKMANRFGSQAVVFSIDLRQDWRGNWQPREKEALRFRKDRWQHLVSRAVECGAGEVLVTNVDREGTRSGLDVELISEIARVTNVPIVVQGGVGSMTDVRAGLNAGADAIAAGAFFVFHGPHDAVLITYPRPEELKLLRSFDRQCSSK